MMSPLREQVETAKREYVAARYSGDLGKELLARQSMREHWIQQRLPWLVPIAAGAMAAMIAIVLWHPRPLADQVATHLPATGPTATPKPDLRNALANIQYQAHYQNMRSGVRQAVGQIAVGVDGRSTPRW